MHGGAFAVHIAADGVQRVLFKRDNVVEDAHGADAAQKADRVERRGLHIRAEHAALGPIGIDLCFFVGIKAVVAARDARVKPIRPRFSCANAGKEQLAVRYGGKDRVDIGLARAVVPHRTVHEDEIADLDLRLQRSAAADADHILYAEVVKLLHGDSGGSAADARGHREHPNTLVASDQTAIFAIVGKLAYVGKKRLDAIQPGGIARQKGADGTMILIQPDVRL